VRAYAAGSNEGIDIAASAGDEVVAAAAGTVAAITRDTNGIAIVVIRHATDLLTVYTNLDGLTVAEGASVRQGQKIGVVKATNPAVVHFEVRLSGMKSANPEDYLP
jgi:murein DD-endopeptidase MepM/ murein hydrolase activator NlpD